MASMAKAEESGILGQRSKGTRNLPYQEYVKRREEGCCFQCGLAFGLCHKCLEKSLRIVILAEDEHLNDEGVITRIELEVDSNHDVG